MTRYQLARRLRIAGYHDDDSVWNIEVKQLLKIVNRIEMKNIKLVKSLKSKKQ